MADRGVTLLDTGTIRIKAGPDGLFAYPVNDEFVGRSVDLYGEWSPGDAEVIAPYLRPGDTALDIGANIGTLTLFMARQVGRAGRVHAFEPVRASCRVLVTNLALNGLTQVDVHPVAVGAERGETRVPDIDFEQGGNYGAASLASADGRTVSLVAIDDLALDACRLIKADVEGHERDVIAGAAKTVARFRPILLLENEEPSLSRALIEDLLSLHYELWWHSPTLFRPNNAFACPENVFPGLGSLNLLGLPREQTALARPDLRPVNGPDDWPNWWPDWSKQGT